MANRRRTDFLDEASDWEEFPGHSHATRHFAGAANFDEIEFPTKGSAGMTVRLYDRERRQWQLYWSSSRTGTFEPPVVGGFTDGRGEFYGDDTHDGRAVRVRYLWSEISAETARWEQGFSLDGGGTWLTNWIMRFTR